MADLMRPEDLKKISDDADMAKAQEYIRRAKKQEDEQKGLREAFMERDLHPEVKDRVNAAGRHAARGLRSSSRDRSSGMRRGRPQPRHVGGGVDEIRTDRNVFPARQAAGAGGRWFESSPPDHSTKHLAPPVRRWRKSRKQNRSLLM